MDTFEKYQNHSYPNVLTALELIKPITWFPPMWAFLCGAVSTGLISLNNLSIVFLGIILSGPIVCGMSQAVNDWYDRHVDAINEPTRPIPSGRMPGRWGLWIALSLSLLSITVGWFLGTWGFIATIIGVTCAWIYSAEPIRLKKSGFFGPFLVGFCYEGLPWFTGAAVISIGFPEYKTVILAVLFALGAFGIMTLNDFKAVEGDKLTGVKSLPVTLGEKLAVRIACGAMLLPQIFVIVLLSWWDLNFYAVIVTSTVIMQTLAMTRLLKNPKAWAPWYNGTGVMLYISGMMVSAIAVGSQVRVL